MFRYDFCCCFYIHVTSCNWNLAWFAVTELATPSQQWCFITAAYVGTKRRSWCSLEFRQYIAVGCFLPRLKFRLPAPRKCRNSRNLQRTTARSRHQCPPDGATTSIRPWPISCPWPISLWHVQPRTERDGKSGVFPHKLVAVCRSPGPLTAIRQLVLWKLNCSPFTVFLWYFYWSFYCIVFVLILSTLFEDSYYFRAVTS